MSLKDKVAQEALLSTGFTPIKSKAQEERDENRQRDAIQCVEDPLLLKAIEIVTKEDPIIKQVWEHYSLYESNSVLNAEDVKRFWDKVCTCAAELNSKENANDQTI
jgi:hypothetical protein